MSIEEDVVDVGKICFRVWIFSMISMPLSWLLTLAFVCTSFSLEISLSKGGCCSSLTRCCPPLSDPFRRNVNLSILASSDETYQKIHYRPFSKKCSKNGFYLINEHDDFQFIVCNANCLFQVIIVMTDLHDAGINKQASSVFNQVCLLTKHIVQICQSIKDVTALRLEKHIALI